MDVKEKLLARYKLAITIQKIISNNVNRSEEVLVTSLRKLAASSQTEYSIIQKITSSKKNPQFTTLAAIIEGFGISFTDFSKIYDSISDEEIGEYKRSFRQRLKNQQSVSSKTLRQTKKAK